MSFDWIRFLDQYQIEYSESGPNVSRGNVAIHCPFCGVDDPSQHMTVSVEGSGWYCWRKTEHKGRNPARLVQALLSCPLEQARRIVGQQVHVPPDDFHGRVLAALNPPSPAPRRPLSLPPEFLPLREVASARIYLTYLRRRGFTDRQIMTMTKRYGIHYCTRGSFKGRVIFPVIHNKKLVSWVGRTVFPTASPRYRVLSVDEDKAKWLGMQPAVGPITDYLLWYDDLKKSEAETIVLVEGPFDALKVSVLGKKHGVCSTCFFTSSPSDRQIELLYEVLPKFKKRYLLLDRGTLPTAISTISRMDGLGIILKHLPNGVKDPGDLDKEQLPAILY